MASTDTRATRVTKRPVFPHFKPLETADRNELEAFTAQFEPYFDFSFSMLTFYNVEGHTHWCWLNDNLVFRFRDCYGPGTFLTFLGVEHAAATADALVAYAAETHCSQVLWRVPEVTAKAIACASSRFQIDPDRSGFDYVYLTESLARMEGRALLKMRRGVHRFQREHPDHQVVELDLRDPATLAQLETVARRWYDGKRKNETLALQRLATENCLRRAGEFSLLGIGVSIRDSLAGFVLAERTSQEWLLCHFLARCPECDGLADYLVHQTGRVAHQAGAVYLNAAEDAGNTGLRTFKMRLAPRRLLWKFSVSRSGAFNGTYSWLHPKLCVRDTDRYGRGVFACSDIEQDETLMVIAGPVMCQEQERALSAALSDKPIELNEEFSIGPRNPVELEQMPQNFLNHSCAPNAGFRGQVLLVAMRPILAGEEVVFDYAMCLRPGARPSVVLPDCRCEAPCCRRTITTEDWRIPQLQRGYDGYFQWYIQRKIQELKLQTDGP